MNGYYRKDSGSGFTPVTPDRLYDTRDPGHQRLAAGQQLVLKVAGSTPGAPSNAGAVALNLTAIGPDGPGWMRVSPCGRRRCRHLVDQLRTRRGASQHRRHPGRRERHGVHREQRRADFALDLMGYFATGSGYQFQPLAPVRMFDSRLPTGDLNKSTNTSPVGAGTSRQAQDRRRAGGALHREAASVNITAVDAGQATHITAYPCGTLPDSSNLNLAPAQAVTANGAMVKLSSAGELCLYTKNRAHFIVDINGVWL